LESNLSRAIMAPLAYLILYRNRPHSREVLTGIFWGDHPENRARSCLSTALWRLRKALEPRGLHERINRVCGV
jgi:DNA-binding SARP family transcriptional activator